VLWVGYRLRPDHRSWCTGEGRLPHQRHGDGCPPPKERLRPTDCGRASSLLFTMAGSEQNNTGPARLSCVVARDLCWKTPDGLVIIDHAAFALDRVNTGLVGANGCGKTSLIRLIIGELPPTSGAVESNCTIGYLPQHVRVYEDQTVSQVLSIDQTLAAIKAVEDGAFDETLFDAIGSNWDISDRAAAVLSRVGLDSLDFDRTLSTLSGGQVTQVLLAGVLLKKPDFLVLDEPTNNLDQYSRRRLYSVLEEWSGGSLVVSHDRALLGYMDQIAELSSKTIRFYGGDFDQYRQQRQIESTAAERDLAYASSELRRQRAQAQRAQERQQRRASQGQKRRASSGQAAIILGVWKESSEKTASRIRRVHERRVSGAQENLQSARQRIRPANLLQLDIQPVEMPRRKVVADVRDVSFCYPGVTRDVFSNVSLQLMGPERLAIQGSNGSGKTTLVRLILGELLPSRGSVTLGVSRVAYVPQSTLLLNDPDSVLDNFSRISGRPNLNLCREHLSRLLFYGPDVFKPANAISGGERIRLALGAVLCRELPPELLIVDEPTNHLDLDSVEQLESALQQYSGALVVISHDPDFLKAIGIEREFLID
jgi:ATPase subunit of ABC transporter with duplicated ATPase domains